MKWINEIEDVAGKVVLVRAGLNVPMKDGEVVNDFRIRKSLPTLRYLQEKGAKIIVISHIGREKTESLFAVSEVLNTHMTTKFSTVENLDVSKMKNGDVMLLENLRQDEREVENEDSFAKKLASLADVFVQDAFSVSHREHASVVGIPKYIESYGGLLLKEEVEQLTEALSPEHPALFILGGSKFKTKEPLIYTFLEEYDTVFVGGALQNELLAAQGYNVGRSIIEDGIISEEIIESEKLCKVIDVVVEKEDGKSSTSGVDNVSDTDTIVDIGEESISNLSEQLAEYKTVLWNGPLGWYEKGYSDATVKLAHAVAESSAKTFIGGGDTVSIVQKEGLENDFDFVSTGGGAMLSFLLDKTTVGITALEKDSKPN